MTGSSVGTGTFTPRPGAAPLPRMVLAQAGMETRLLLRNGEQLLLAVVIPLIVLVGGITALTDLNPWIVSFHLLVSLAMVGLSVTLIRRLDEGDGPAVPLVPGGVVWLTRAVFVAGWAVLYVGTVVTGSGPHAGDVDAPRNGLDPRSLTQLHTDLVFLLVGLTVAVVLVLRTSGAPATARRAAMTLLVVELAQGVVGFVQYFTDLPVVLVAVHLLGASLLSAAMTWLLVSVRERVTAASGPASPVRRSTPVS